MPIYRSYTWSYRINVPPYDRLLAVLEAFFASYPGGDYEVIEREKYKLAFRRGQWRKALMGLGPMVPDRLVPGDFAQWPILVRVLIRPAPEQFTVTIRYEVHLPRRTKSLRPETQLSVDQHARKEMGDLADYLAQCIPMENPAEIVPLG